MKKKIAIITICDVTNLGNRLQNYATTMYFRKYGCNPVTLELSKTNKNLYLLKNIKAKMARSRVLQYVNGLRKCFNNKANKRIVKFTRFTQKYIPAKKEHYYSAKQLKKLGDRYDYFAIGSDQIWNPLFGWARGTDFAMFADSSKKICVAPSFGISEIPDEYLEQITKGLNSIDIISVREKSGQEIVKKLTGKEAEVLLDPTMWLTAEDWRKIEKKPKLDCKRKYVLTYFLGGKNNNQVEAISKYCKEYDLVEYDVLDKNNLALYSTDPSEFLYLVDHATLVCTDSFHASVFSVLFKKPFVVFDRNGDGQGMGSRLDTLLEHFSLTERKNDNLTEKNVFDVNFDGVGNVLSVGREKADRFVRQIIK